jgi:TolB protein
MVDREESEESGWVLWKILELEKTCVLLARKIIYSAKNLKEESDLGVINQDGTNQTQLTNTSYDELNPSFSPDGKKIASVE